jgi:hypothetical protein
MKAQSSPSTVLSSRAVLVSLLNSGEFRPVFHKLPAVPEYLRNGCSQYWSAILRGLRDGMPVQKAIAAEREVLIAEGRSATDSAEIMEVVRGYFDPAHERAMQIVAAAASFDAQAAEDLEKLHMQGK